MSDRNIRLCRVLGILWGVGGASLASSFVFVNLGIVANLVLSILIGLMFGGLLFLLFRMILKLSA